MLDPKLALAIAMHSSKGVYALLLGSGISRSAGIPTGWEIVVDLIRKLAHLKGENCESDPEAWYRTTTGSEPDYSDILDQVTKSSAERSQVLRSYFEPTEEERLQGRKSPTRAHDAIAALVTKGYIRLIITTNFDRMLEQALSRAGVQPTVISTCDAMRGAIPVTHSPCTVIKVHGDYLDSRIKNTRIELTQYEEAFNVLLDRIFDEFGLIVCGWSAEWDVALRAALERCSTHRFGTYWALRDHINPAAEKLVGVRRATVLPISDADSFFEDLAEKIQALEDYAITDPVSPRIAVARMKRYLAGPEQRINLHDLVHAETDRVYAAMMGSRFSAMTSNIDPAITLYMALVMFYAPAPANFLDKFPYDPFPNKHGPHVKVEWMVSDDLVRWERPFRDTPATRDWRIYFSHAPLELHDRLLFMTSNQMFGEPPDHGARPGQNIEIYSLPADRIVSAGGDVGTVFQTKLFTMPRDPLYVNVEGVVAFEIVDEDGRTIPGFSKTAAESLDELHRKLTWNGKDTSAVAGKKVYVRFHPSGGRIYSLHTLTNQPWNK